ncbi:MAG: sulfite exporter TauE/SafE family protein [Sedimenticola sp.]|nr:sulfite exporter TauE/SafE family protein [Sedimenticola sp.]
MVPLEPVSLSLGAALLLGLGFGAGPCNIACLPYLGPVFAATGDGIRSSWRIILPFSAGRMAGYAVLGLVAGWLGLLVQEWVAAPWVRWVLGGATMVVALSLLFRTRRGGSACTSREVKLSSIGRERSAKQETLLPGGLFFMGAGMALNPCAPLTTVILAAATTGRAESGLLLGLLFGFGAVLIPTTVFSIGVAHFGQQLKQHMSRWGSALEHASVALLMLMGAGTALGWISP